NSLISEGKRMGAKISDEAAEYEKVSEEASLKRIEDLCLRGSYNEANNRLDKAQTTYESARKALLEKIDVSKNINARISDISGLYSEAKELVESAQKLNVDVSFEQREMRSLNVEDLRKRALEKPGAETDALIQKGEEALAKTKKSLEQKLSLYKALSEKRDELAKSVDEIKALVSKAVALNVDVSAEHEKFFTIKMDKVDRMLSKFEDFTGLQNAMNEYMKTADFCSSSLREKLDVVDGGAGTWGGMIDQKLNRGDKVSSSSLVEIPERWRKWSLDRYVSEHKEDYFVLQDGVLVRLMRSDAKKECEGVISSVSKSGKISACIVMNPDGMTVSSNLPKDADAGRTAKALASAISELSRFAKCGRISQVAVKTSGSMSLVLATDEYGYLVCVSRPTEDASFLSIIASPAAEKIASILAPKEI
ncbi:MAG: hypothetical protein NT157_06350, partial [Candidatus Micrarchaeota archaeon]|nr:hypothetical protein [Candidatus Micrarchaeota archaeon]